MEQPETIRWFPHPGKMISKKLYIKEENNNFVRYLDDWFYRIMSQFSHLNSWTALADRGNLILRDPTDEADLEVMLKLKSDFLVTTLVLFLATVTECNLILGTAYKSDLQYLWTVISEYFLFAEELYERRYREMLAGNN